MEEGGWRWDGLVSDFQSWADNSVVVTVHLQKIETNVGSELEDVPNPSKGYQYFDSARKNGEQYRVGDCCYIHPDAYDFAIKPEKAGAKPKADQKVNGLLV